MTSRDQPYRGFCLCVVNLIVFIFDVTFRINLHPVLKYIYNNSSELLFQCMLCRTLLFIAFLFISSDTLIAQNEKGAKVSTPASGAVSGHTYALIIGISKYESFSSLQFADKDAKVFYEFLRSPAGGKIDSADIFFRTNEKAKAGDIWQGMSWLERRADSVGETAIIYFSGHGDAANAAEAYLLAYDAPNEGDPNMYNMGGTFQIYNLKVKIKKMVAKGVRVLFISDACRSNDLPGKESGAKWMFQSITEEKAGEIQMASCSSNEFSLEDKSWGEGRGVFSYWLLNGLSGMADNDPEDGKISLYELERYVKDNVRKDTRSLSTGKPRQTPVFCCTENSDIILATIDPATKALVQKALDMNKADMSLAYATKRGSLFSDSLQQLYYSNFQTAVSKKIFLGANNTTANYWFTRLLETISDELIRNDLSDEYCSALINEAQVRITLYSKPLTEDLSASLNYRFFHEGAELLKEAGNYLTKNEAIWKNVEARRLFMEARALAESVNKDKLNLGLRKIDSSINILNTAYAWHTKGMLLNALRQFHNSIFAYNKALELSKDWIFPIGNLGALYVDRKMFDSAIFFLRKVIALKPNYANAYLNMAISFEKNHQLDSSFYYYKYALALSPKFANAWSNYGQTLIDNNSPDSGFNCLKKALTLDPENIVTLSRIGDLFVSKKIYNTALEYYNKALLLDADYADTYNDIAILYADKGVYDSAKIYYLRSLALDPDNGNVWNNLGILYENKKLNAEALQAYHKAIEKDKTLNNAYFNVADIYFKSKKYDSAIRYFRITTELDSICSDCYYNLGKVYKEIKEWEMAIPLFKKSFSLDPKNDVPVYYIGKYYSDVSQFDSAAKYMNIALQINPEDDVNNNSYGLLLETIGKYDSSIFYFKKCIRLQSRNTMYWTNLGISCTKAAKLDSALAAFNEALRIDPNLSFVYSNRAEVFKMMKLYAKALKDLEMLLKWDKQNFYAWNEAALCLYYEKNYKKAISYFNKAIENGMEPAFPLYNIACSYSLLKFKNEALQYLKKSLQNGYNETEKIKRDTDFEWLWEDTDFKRILQEVK